MWHKNNVYMEYLSKIICYDEQECLFLNIYSLEEQILIHKFPLSKLVNILFVCVILQQDHSSS